MKGDHTLLDHGLRLLPPYEDDSSNPPENLVLTADEQLAMELGAQLQAVLMRIDGLLAPQPITRRSAAGARTVPREFLTSMIAAVEQLDEVRNVGTFDPAEAREMLRFHDGFRPFARRMAMLLANLRYLMEARQAKVAKAAMTTYTIMKGLARDAHDGSALHQHLEILHRVLGRRNGTRKRKP